MRRGENGGIHGGGTQQSGQMLEIYSVSLCISPTPSLSSWAGSEVSIQKLTTTPTSPTPSA